MHQPNRLQPLKVEAALSGDLAPMGVANTAARRFGSSKSQNSYPSG
jgi:hypothetical protein